MLDNSMLKVNARHVVNKHRYMIFKHEFSLPSHMEKQMAKAQPAYSLGDFAWQNDGIYIYIQHFLAVP